MRLLLSCVMVLALAFPAMAAQGGFQGPGQAPGGFQGPTSGVQADTVAKALKAWDDAPVMLTGHIVERVAGSDDKYNFRDATGTIVVEIDHEVFAGRTVTPADRVRLSGKLDKEMMDPTKVDVKVLEILKESDRRAVRYRRAARQRSRDANFFCAASAGRRPVSAPAGYRCGGFRGPRCLADADPCGRRAQCLG